MNNMAAREREFRRERAVSSARIFFASMAMCLQLAVSYAEDATFQLDIFSHTIFSFDMPFWYKWIWGILAIIFLIWAIIVFLTARSDRLAQSRMGHMVERSIGVSSMLAVIIVGLGWVQGCVFALQAGIGEWYFWVVFPLGLIFYFMYAVFPVRRAHLTTDR